MDQSDYQNSVDRFSQALTREHTDVCFFIYGSFERGKLRTGFNKYHPRKNSDVDGGIILDVDVITPKEKIREISQLFSRYWNHRISAQINLLDTRTGEDGRFLSYTIDYTDYLIEKAKVLSGPNHLPKLNGFGKKEGNLYASAYNLRKRRNNLVLAATDIKRMSPEDFVERTQEAIDGAVKLPKKLIFLRNPSELIVEEQEARTELGKILPACDFSTLDMLISLRNLSETESPLRNLEYCWSLQEVAVDAMEQMIKSYINTFPEHTERELIN